MSCTATTTLAPAARSCCRSWCSPPWAPSSRRRRRGGRRSPSPRRCCSRCWPCCGCRPRAATAPNTAGASRLFVAGTAACAVLRPAPPCCRPAPACWPGVCWTSSTWPGSPPCWSWPTRPMRPGGRSFEGGAVREVGDNLVAVLLEVVETVIERDGVWVALGHGVGQRESVDRHGEYYSKERRTRSRMNRGQVPAPARGRRLRCGRNSATFHQLAQPRLGLPREN